MSEEEVQILVLKKLLPKFKVICLKRALSIANVLRRGVITH